MATAEAMKFHQTQPLESQQADRYRSSLPKIFHAADLGVVCDGITDDGPALSTIFSKAEGTKARVVLPAGTCLTSVQLVVRSELTLAGSAGATVIAPSSENKSNPLLLLIANQSNIRIQNVVFDGTADKFQSVSSPLITIYKSEGVVFENIVVQNARGIGLNFSTDISNSGVKSSIFRNIGIGWKSTGLNTDQQQGIAFSSGTRERNHGNFVVDSEFSEIGLDAVSVSQQSGFGVLHNRFHNVGGRATNGGAAIYVAQSSGVIILGNVIDRAYGNGIDVYRSNNVSISSNHVQRSSAGGIIFAAGSNCTITGNISINNNQDGKSSFVSGIAFNGGLHGDPLVSDCSVTANVSADFQKDKTQHFGFQIIAGAKSARIWIDRSNVLTGNAISGFGGELHDYSEMLSSSP